MAFCCGIDAVGNQGDSACLFLLLRLPIMTVKSESFKLVGIGATSPKHGKC